MDEEAKDLLRQMCDSLQRVEGHLRYLAEAEVARRKGAQAAAEAALRQIQQKP